MCIRDRGASNFFNYNLVQILYLSYYIINVIINEFVISVSYTHLKSEEKISFERLNNMVKPLEKLSMERIYLVIDKNQTTASFINNNYLVITLSSERTSLEEELNGLITNINSSDNKVSQSQRNTK